MKENKIWSCTISMNMFFSDVVVFITNSKEYLEREIEKVLSDDLGMKESYSKEFGSEIQKYLREENILPPGVTLYIECSTGAKDAFVVFDGTPKTIDKEVVIHEMCHVMQNICRERGIKDDETEAYMLEYLCHNVFEQLDSWNKTPKKG